MNKLSQAIDQAVEDCKINGSGIVRLTESFIITTEWEEWEADSSYDVITVYIQDGIMIGYQLEETKILA